MKTPCTLKNGRLADTVGKHSQPLCGIAQVGILLYQCFHTLNMAQNGSSLKLNIKA